MLAPRREVDLPLQERLPGYVQAEASPVCDDDHIHPAIPINVTQSRTVERFGPSKMIVPAPQLSPVEAQGHHLPNPHLPQDDLVFTIAVHISHDNGRNNLGGLVDPLVSTGFGVDAVDTIEGRPDQLVFPIPVKITDRWLSSRTAPRAQIPAPHSLPSVTDPVQTTRPTGQEELDIPVIIDIVGLRGTTHAPQDRPIPNPDKITPTSEHIQLLGQGKRELQDPVIVHVHKGDLHEGGTKPILVHGRENPSQPEIRSQADKPPFISRGE